MGAVLLVKYCTNIQITDWVGLPASGLAVIAVPNEKGMAFVCNSEETWQLLYTNFPGTYLLSGQSNRLLLGVILYTGDDYGLSSFRNTAEESGFELKEEGGIPWLK